MQALAFGWLGRWHEVVAQDFEKAQECYEKALTLDPKDSIAGGAQSVGWAHFAHGVGFEGVLLKMSKAAHCNAVGSHVSCLLTLLPLNLVPSPSRLVTVQRCGLLMLSFHLLLLPRPHCSLLRFPRDPLHCRGRFGEAAAAGEDCAVSQQVR